MNNIPVLNLQKTVKSYLKLPKYIDNSDKNKIIEVLFVKFTPSFEIIERNITYFDLLGELGNDLFNKFDNAGLDINTQKWYIKIVDYKKLLVKLFQSFVIKDCQRIGRGHPDFKLTHNDDSNFNFYIEIKNEGDGIKSAQLQWLIRNKECEVWFMFLKNNS